MTPLLSARRLAVLGFGNQGEAHARLLRSSGCTVVVGARPEGAGARRAREQGFEVRGPAEALASSDVAAMLFPDETLPSLWGTLETSLRDGHALVFAHGFNLLYGGVAFPPGCDVVLVAPTAPGRALEGVGASGARVPAYVAVHQDGSGEAEALALEYAERMGLGPIRRTTVREETEIDLFGEQVVLCGGMNALAVAAFETLVAAGYEPEMAYLECVHQIRYLAELLNARGVAGFRRAISGTALYGDLTRGPRVIGPESRKSMESILEEIRDGRFAREWRAEVAAGRPRLDALVEKASKHRIEQARRAALSGGREGPDGA